MLTRTLSNLRRQWLGASLGMLALFVAIGGATVFAHGGDPNQVHACVISGTGGSSPNVRIVGANESCPGGSTAVDFAIQGPQGPQGEKGDAGERGPAGAAPGPDPGSFAELSDQFNFTIKKSTTLQNSTPMNNLPFKGVKSPPCPSNFPKAVTGGYDTTGLVSNAQFVVTLNTLHPIQKRWIVSAIANNQGNPWQLTAYIVCKK
jgi:hypothetical protein